MVGTYSDTVNVHQSASILDKTDWRKTIHKCLEQCVYSEGTTIYPKAVRSLISAVSANYPGFKAKDDIDKFISDLQDEYKEAVFEFVTNHPEYWNHPGKRKFIEPDVVNQYYKSIFEFIKDLLASKRILLYGIRKIAGGTQSPDPED